MWSMYIHKEKTTSKSISNNNNLIYPPKPHSKIYYTMMMNQGTLHNLTIWTMIYTDTHCAPEDIINNNNNTEQEVQWRMREPRGKHDDRPHNIYIELLQHGARLPRCNFFRNSITHQLFRIYSIIQKEIFGENSKHTPYYRKLANYGSM